MQLAEGLWNIDVSSPLSSLSSLSSLTNSSNYLTFQVMLQSNETKQSWKLSETFV